MMSHFFFIFILFLAQIIRGPISVFLIVVKNIVPALKKRIDFERKNFLEEECRSFKRDRLVADYCFEVSSEGELEQVRPLIETFLKEGKKIEVLFASPSVETKCQKLARDNPEQVRIFRLPLATHFFLFQTARQFMTAPKLIFCRYDFYPELLLLKYSKKTLILVNGAAGKKPSWFKSRAYQFFDLVIAANDYEARLFIEREHKNSNKVFSFDFRVPRIFDRVDRAPQILSQVKELETYLAFLKSGLKKNRLVLGSAWESDLVIFSDDQWKKAIASGDVHLLVVPHDLSARSIQSIKDHLTRLFPETPVYEVSRSGSDWNASAPGIVLLNLSGVLCELYTQFDLVYVGGGYARSIHSVLEPFLAGAKVFCGPRVHRSTEYDFIEVIARDEIQLLNNAESFYTLFKEKAATPPDRSLREELKSSSVEKMKTVIHEIEAC